MDKQTEIKKLRRKQYWLLALMGFIVKKPMPGIGPVAVINLGFKLLQLSHQIRILSFQSAMIAAQPEPKYPEGGIVPYPDAPEPPVIPD